MSAAQPYQGKPVCVIGATGFIGSALVARLVSHGAHVTAFARGSASPALRELHGARIALGDVRSAADVAQATRDAEFVFMMAGRSGAVESVKESREDLDVNCGGLLNVLETLRAQKLTPRVIFPGSRLQYGKPTRMPVREDDPLQPLVPYGLHKVFCEKYMEFFARQYGFTTAIVRLTNPYGPAPTRYFRGYNLLNAMIAKALAGEAIPIYGEGLQLRDYLYVDDTVELLLAAGGFPSGTIVNGGSGIGVSIAEVAASIVRIAQSGRVEHIAWPAAAAQAETGDFVADISRARSLGWAPATSLENGLRATIEAQRQLGQ